MRSVISYASAIRGFIPQSSVTDVTAFTDILREAPPTAEGRKATKQVVAVVKAVIYAVLGYGVLKYALLRGPLAPVLRRSKVGPAGD
jgi:hypothetical protein